MAITDNLILTPNMVHTTYDTDKMTLRLTERQPMGAKLETFSYSGSATEADDGKFTALFSKTEGVRSRRMVKLTHAIIGPDPYGVNVPISASVYIVMDFPLWGYTSAQKTSLMNTFRGGQGSNDSVLTDPDVRNFLELGIVL